MINVASPGRWTMTPPETTTPVSTVPPSTIPESTVPACGPVCEAATDAISLAPAGLGLLWAILLVLVARLVMAVAGD